MARGLSGGRAIRVVRVDARPNSELAHRMFKSIVREIAEDRSGEIHVTDLVYSCVRRAYYEKVLKYGVVNRDSAIILWMGKKLHETGMIGCDHEVPIEMELGGVRVVGSIDELCDDGDLIIDKKSAKNAPSQPYEHHVFQVLLYAVALRKMGRRVPSRGAIVYFDKTRADIRAYEFKITGKLLDEVEYEATRRARELAEALEKKRPPKPRPGWLCNYCPYVSVCALEDDSDEDARSIDEFLRSGGRDE